MPRPRQYALPVRRAFEHPYTDIPLPPPKVLIPWPHTAVVRENLEFLSPDPEIAAITALTSWLENGCQSTCRIGWNLINNWPHTPLLLTLPDTALHAVLTAWADQQRIHTSDAALWGLLHVAGGVWRARHPGAPLPTADDP